MFDEILFVLLHALFVASFLFFLRLGLGVKASSTGESNDIFVVHRLLC